MTAERWRQVKTIFIDVVELDPSVRPQVVRDRCGSDEELRREVESLLASELESRSLLDNPILGAGALAAAAPLPDVDPMVGRAIGNYIITGELAHGGMGTVYRARHVSLPRDVVVKCIRPRASLKETQEELRARFRQEAHIQSQMDHRHIVRVYEFFAGVEEYFLVMEYVSGSTIRSMLDQRRVLPVTEAVALAIQALDGLSHAHGLRYVDESGRVGVGIIHRDIKPANLLVDEQGNLKLTDFGIARAAGGGRLTKVGSSPGTFEYMSPEQVQVLPLDARSDLYSLGVTLYEMLTGHVPQRPGFGYDIRNAQVEQDRPSIRTLNPDIPAALAEVVTRSLQADPGQRWQTATEFRDRLISCATPTHSIAKNKLHLHRWILMAAAAFLALVLSAGASWLGHREKTIPVQPSIAVLPFLDISPDKDQEHFSDGLAEELLNALANTPGLLVTGRSSSFQFKGKTGDLRAIGQKLHVANILEGSVRRQGNRAKITVQLIKAADSFHLWSETYDRKVDNIFIVQEEIARAVARALKVTLLGNKKALFAKSTNTEAYNAYLQGRYLFRGGNKKDLEKAAGYFEQAVKLDPNYARGWVGLGETRETQAGSAYIPVEEGYRSARAAVERALVLDPDLADAHGILGEIQMLRDWDWAGAKASFERALALQPGNPGVMKAAGSLARILGSLDEAIDYYRRAIEIDPLFGHRNLGLNLYYAGLQDEARTALNKALELNPDTTKAHAFLGQVYLAQLRPREALAEAEKEKYPIYRLTGLAMAYHALGRITESDASLAQLIAKFQADSPYQIAGVYAYRGQTGRAFKFLDLAYTLRDPGLSEMKADPLLRSLRGDQRYTALLKKMRLPL
jgi:serine/threonine protein kinase/cytochrome c-type biogenesis protein CcmH/NrfG